MTKKDYERAATIAQRFGFAMNPKARPITHTSVVDAFAELFRGDNSRFDEDRFRRACVPGANVRAKGCRLRVPETTHADWHGNDCDCDTKTHARR